MAVRVGVVAKIKIVNAAGDMTWCKMVQNTMMKNNSACCQRKSEEEAQCAQRKQEKMMMMMKLKKLKKLRAREVIAALKTATYAGTGRQGGLSPTGAADQRTDCVLQCLCLCRHQDAGCMLINE